MKKEDQNIFEKFTEAIGGFLIFLSPFLIAVIIAAFIYFPNPNTITLIIAIAIILLGIILGVKLALKIYKTKKGTIHFVSRTDATPDIDELLNQKEKGNDPG
ncbi:hypothetical protein CHRYSEOSP005_01360 [Chryseobacterium sp. Alg-005]|uniref:hypothetical protein n=1 Tax=Chryseobacterium sp. Alg-005 TaxID=3159516 RepID=UPI0035558861